jgi:hypothetical protein
MSADVAALLKLFPEKTPSPPRPSPPRSLNLRGRLPYEVIEQRRLKYMLSPELVAGIDAVKNDPRWSCVFRGETTAYNDDASRADLALCGEFARRGLNAGGINLAMRASGLFRPKWERDDYREATIARATNSIQPKEPEHNAAIPDLRDGEICIDFGIPKPRDWVIEDLLLAGKSFVLAGLGGVSKTQLAIQLAVNVAIGQCFQGRAIDGGNVLLMLGEEDREEISRRISAFAKREKYNVNDVQCIKDRVRAFGLVGRDMRLLLKERSSLIATRVSDDIIARAKELGSVRLIVLDHIALLHGGDFNAREDAAQTMRIVNHIALETKAAVLLLAHSPKSVMQSNSSNRAEPDATAIAGSTAFVDQARGAWVLTSMSEGDARKYRVLGGRKSFASLTVVKNNYAPTGDIFWFKRVAQDGVGLLEPTQMSIPSGSQKDSELGSRIIEFVRAHPGQFSKTRLRDTQSGKTRRFRASKNDVEASIEALLSANQLINRPPTIEERKKFGHCARVTHVLDVGRST